MGPLAYLPPMGSARPSEAQDSQPNPREGLRWSKEELFLFLLPTLSERV